MNSAHTLEKITAAEFSKRLAGLCLTSGLAGFPRKERDRQILLKSVVMTMDRTLEYTEPEVDDRLIYWLTDIARSVQFDHVSLRRLLVDYGYLNRDSTGSSYRVVPAGGGRVAFEAQIDGLDVYGVIGAAMKAARDRKRRFAQGG